MVFAMKLKNGEKVFETENETIIRALKQSGYEVVLPVKKTKNNKEE